MTRWMKKRHDCQATKKGELSNCNNWQGITVLSVPGKVLCSVLLNRLKDDLDKRLWEEQAASRSGRSCSEQILTLRNIIEQSFEFSLKVFITFVDFKKAFDNIHRESVCKIAKIYGIPEKYINIFENLYLNSSCCIRTNSGHTDYFNIMTGVQQGCIILLLFLLTIDFVMHQATSDPQLGIPWDTRCLTDVDFADDLALLGENAKSLQSMTDNLASTALKIGLRIITEKTKVM